MSKATTRRTQSRVVKKSKSIRTLADLTPDDRNANLGTDRGRGMLEHSLQAYGPGRSILADRAGNVIAGNKTLEQAKKLGLKIRVVKTKGDQLVVVQREDLRLSDPKARALAVADNRVSQADLNWDRDVLAQLHSADVDLSQFWTEEELLKMVGAAAGGADTASQIDGLEYRVVVDCRDEAHQRELLDRFESEGLQARALIS